MHRSLPAAFHKQLNWLWTTPIFIMTPVLICNCMLMGDNEVRGYSPHTSFLHSLCLICSLLADWTVPKINWIRKYLALHISDQKNGLKSRFETPDTKPLWSMRQCRDYGDSLTSPRWLFVSVTLETVMRSVFALQFKLFSCIFKAVLSQIPHSLNVTGCQLDICHGVILLGSIVRTLQC